MFGKVVAAGIASVVVTTCDAAPASSIPLPETAMDLAGTIVWTCGEVVQASEPDRHQAHHGR